MKVYLSKLCAGVYAIRACHFDCLQETDIFVFCFSVAFDSPSIESRGGTYATRKKMLPFTVRIQKRKLMSNAKKKTTTTEAWQKNANNKLKVFATLSEN